MDLQIKDVAELLNLSETTVSRWVEEGKIPSYLLNHQHRFNAMEIEEWMLSHEKDLKVQEKEMIALDSEEAKQLLTSRMGTQTFSLFRSINKGGVFSDIPGETKEEVIQAAVKQIAQNLSLDVDVFGHTFEDPVGLGAGLCQHCVIIAAGDVFGDGLRTRLLLGTGQALLGTGQRAGQKRHIRTILSEQAAG